MIRAVFLHFIRRTRLVSGSPYYIFPVIAGGCGVEKEREGIADFETNIDLGQGDIGGSGGGGYSAADIEQGRTVEAGAPGSATSKTVTMIVPDGVSSVTIHFPAGRASGYSQKISPPATITTPAVNDEIVVRVPRTTWPESGHGITMTWRAANRHIIRRFDRL